MGRRAPGATGRRRAVALAACALAPAGAVAPVALAGGPTVSTPERCYSSSRPVDFVGLGFRPGRTFTARVGDRVVDRGSVSRFGDLAGAFRAPVAARGRPGERTFTLTVDDGLRAASTRFRSTVFGADFAPAIGDPATLRVRFQAFDFGRGRTVYLHLIAPDRRHRRTLVLGRTSGPCGSVVTARRRLFPFRPRPGTWRMQFDTSRRYRPGAVPRVRLAVPVLRARR
jgi:hypothetical protein